MTIVDSMAGGRPTDYTPENVEKANWYLDGGWREVGDKVPSVAGLACELGLSRETLRRWGKDKGNAFCGILGKIASLQERQLVNNGLSNEFSGTITKLMLHHHGYSDKVESDHTSSDGSMKPTTVVLKAADHDPDSSGN